MADNKEEISGMKTIEASTRIDLETPVVNLEASATLAGKWTGATGFVISEPKTADVTVGETPVYVEVIIWGVTHYIAAYPVAWD